MAGAAAGVSGLVSVDDTSVFTSGAGAAVFVSCAGADAGTGSFLTSALTSGAEMTSVFALSVTALRPALGLSRSMVPRILGPAGRRSASGRAARCSLRGLSFFSSRRVPNIFSASAFVFLSLLNSLVSMSTASESIRALGPSSTSMLCFRRNSTAVLTPTLRSLATLLIFVRIYNG